MDSTAARWYFEVPLGERWEPVELALMDHPVEAILEVESRARVYFARREEAMQALEGAGLNLPLYQEESRIPVTPFGTENHPTTQMCLELLRECVRPGVWVADIGSGIGVLSEAAARWGAAMVVGADHDAPAARATRELLATYPQAHAAQGGAECLAAGRFDVVAANLHLGLLRKLWPEFYRIAKPGARAVLSGYFVEQGSEIAEMVESCGCRVGQSLERNGWSAMRVEKASSIR